MVKKKWQLELDGIKYLVKVDLKFSGRISIIFNDQVVHSERKAVSYEGDYIFEYNKHKIIVRISNYFYKIGYDMIIDDKSIEEINNSISGKIVNKVHPLVNLVSGALIFFGVIWLFPIIFLVTQEGIIDSSGYFLIITDIILFLSGFGIRLGKRWVWWICNVFLSVLCTAILYGLITNHGKFNPMLLLFFGLLFYLYDSNVIKHLGVSNISINKRITVASLFSVSYLIITITTDVLK